ncbi:MAG: hypothetical protein ABI654_02440 [Betaproteobacteria bacterium]
MRWAIKAALIALALAPLPGLAQSFRVIQPIAVPDPQLREAILQGQQLRGQAIPGLRQVPREAVEEAVRKIYASYNTPDFRQYLSERFYDPDRLAEAIVDKALREAKLRLISVNSATTVSQQPATDEQGRAVTESLVMVVVKAQMEFTSVAGFQRREGESELILRFRQR